MEKWIIWCDLNAEQNYLKKLFGNLCVSIDGSTTNEKKVEMEKEWREGDTPILISKPKVFGMGMNWQKCHNMAFVGLSDSFEQVYQAIRRCWRFGQENQVNVYLITSELEGSTLDNIKRKQKDFEKMQRSMTKYTKNILEDVKETQVDKAIYSGLMEMKIPQWLREETA